MKNKNVDEKSILEQSYSSDLNKIKRKLKNKVRVAMSKDLEIINDISLWKTKQPLELSNELIEILNTISCSFKTQEEAFEDKLTKDFINELTSTLEKKLLIEKESALSLTYTILHLYNEEIFPDVDNLDETSLSKM